MSGLVNTAEQHNASPRKSQWQATIKVSLTHISRNTDIQLPRLGLAELESRLRGGSTLIYTSLILLGLFADFFPFLHCKVFKVK